MVHSPLHALVYVFAQILLDKSYDYIQIRNNKIILILHKKISIKNNRK